MLYNPRSSPKSYLTQEPIVGKPVLLLVNFDSILLFASKQEAKIFWRQHSGAKNELLVISPQDYAW